jgi:hypothetical protein
VIIALDAIIDSFGGMKREIFFEIVSTKSSESSHAIPLSP